MSVCQLWTHSNRPYFVSVVEVNNIFKLDLNIFMFKVALHEIAPHILAKRSRVINDKNKKFLVVVKYVELFY